MCAASCDDDNIEPSIVQPEVVEPKPEPQVNCEHLCDADQKKCLGDTLVSCGEDVDGCRVWIVEKTCGDGTVCNDSSHACESCAEGCPVGNRRCAEGGVESCALDSRGCAVWGMEQSCMRGYHCDAEQLTCVAGCENACIAGMTRCAEGGEQTCVWDAENNCFVWSEAKSCETGQRCYAESGKCEYGCGTDCEPFSLVILPDSQYYLTKYDECFNSKYKDTVYCEKMYDDENIFAKQMRWIVANKDKENIRFVMHMGDIVNDNTHSQYTVAQDAYRILSDAGIPYSVSTGNHEYKAGDTNKTTSRERSMFSQFFNDDFVKSSFASKGHDTNWFHGFKYSDNMYATFEVGHLKFAVIALEFAPRKDVLCWADNLIRTELRDRYVILTTHAYLQSNGRVGADVEYKYFNGMTITAGKSVNYNKYTPVGASGDDLYRELAARHSNVIMVASGHFCEIASRDRAGYNGNIFHETLVDYQCERPCLSNETDVPTLSKTNCCVDTSIMDNGNGWFRQIKIDPMKFPQNDADTVNNASATTLSALNDYQSAGHMYCGENVSTYSKVKLYDADLSGKDHNYQFNIDFISPVHYQYSDNDDKSFGVRDINENLYGNQLYPKTAVNRQTGDFIVVWEDNSSEDDGVDTHAGDDAPDKDNHDIEARIFCAGGCQQTRQFTINTLTKGQQRHPDVAMDKDGNFVVVWEDDYGSDGYYQIYMRGFDAQGRERFGYKTVNSLADNQQYWPVVAMAPDGNFVVAWEDYSDNETKPQIFIRGFNPDGTERFHDRNTRDSVEGSRRRPDIAMAGDGSFVVTWEDDSGDDGYYQIHARAFNADGTPKTDRFAVNSVDTGQQFMPSIAMNDAGDFYVTYYDESDGPENPQIKARGFDASKKEIFKDQVISVGYTIDMSAAPTVCLADDRSAVFGWRALSAYKYADSYIDIDGDIYRVRANKDGNLITNADGKPVIDRVNVVRGGEQSSPDVACSADGRYVFVFSDDDDTNGITDIFGRGYNRIE